MRMERKTMLLLALAALTAVFSLGFFAGRRTAHYAVTAQVQKSDAPEGSHADEAQAPAEQEDAPEKTGPIDLNTASLEELMTLPRIGEKIAQRILDYRAQYGRFSAIEQLMDVEGIGEATFEGLKDLVTVDEHQ